MQEVNNFFGDMDLFLMDFVLKGYLDGKNKVLDVGSGSGRNSIYFIQQGFDVTCIDRDETALQLLQHSASSLEVSQLKVHSETLLDFKEEGKYDFIICSRMLHFVSNRQEFESHIDALDALLGKGGVLYLAMDSAIGDEYAKKNGDLTVFKGGKKRFALTTTLYKYLLQRFKEVESLRTVHYGDERTQSFALLAKR